MKFSIGNKIIAYDDERMVYSGRIASFAGENRAILRVDNTGDSFLDYKEIRLQTAHLLPIYKVTHSKETFLAAASRCGPHLYFKDDQSRRDYLDALWKELENYSLDD